MACGKAAFEKWFADWGLWVPCAGSVTPWGTHLGSEEYEPDAAKVGCPADTDVTDGVVDGFGRVRGVPGLRVCDGSVFPGPTGANPSLTIAAFADRVATHMRDTDDAPWPEVRTA